MEESKETIQNIENKNNETQNEPTNINNENISEKKEEIKEEENKKELDIDNQTKKPKGYVRIFRNFIKKKSDIINSIIKNRFINWRTKALKGLKYKKTIYVRISVSKEKDQRDKNKDLLQIDIDNGKSRSVNKREIRFNFSKNNNIKKENPDDINIKNNENNNQNIKDKDKDKDKEKNNLKTYNNIAKINIEKNKGNNNNSIINNVNINKEKNNLKTNEKIKNLIKIKNNEKINISDTIPNIKNDYIKPQKKSIIEISGGKPRKTPEITKTLNKNIKTKNKLSAQFNKINNPPLENKNTQKYIPKNLQDNKQKEPNKFKKINTNNLGIVYSTSHKKIKEEKNNPLNNSNFTDKKNILKTIENTNDKNKSKGYHIKYDGYHDNKNIYTTIPTRTIDLNLKDYTPYNLNKKITSIKSNTNNKKNYIKLNNNDINLYQRKTHQIINNNKRQNYIIAKNSNNNTKNNVERNNNFSTSKRERLLHTGQKSLNKELSLKEGITTVIQHFKGKIEEFENYENNNSSKNKNISFNK